MKRFLAALGVVSALIWLAPPAFAQTAGTTRVLSTCSTASYTAGKFNYPTQDLNGNACTSSGGGGGGGVAGFTAEATASAVAAGTNKPASISTANGAQRVVPMKPGTTTEIDLSAPSVIAGADAATANSIINPTFIANAEAADTSGTFTNGTQTTSITNSSADGYAAGLISINGTYGTASGVFEVSDDGGTTWYSVICGRSDGSASETGYTSLTNTNRQWACPVGGNDSLRLRSTAVSSGTVNGRVGVSAPPPSSNTTFGSVSINAGTNLIGGVQGAAANGASVSGNPLLEGCRAATAAPTAVTDGQVATALCGDTGKRVELPYTIKELAVRGSTGAVTNTAQTSIIASAGGSLKNYITAIQCANSGATTSILTFTDAAATILINPAGGGGSWVFPVPLATAAATAFQVTPGSSSTSQYCSAQGYTGL